MEKQPVMTAAEFSERRYELPESGRWHELHDGLPVLLSAPDDVYGNIVRNLSGMLGMWFRTQPAISCGYACFGLGLHVKQSPDTVYFPAITVFREGRPFSQSDLAIATEVPRVVVDIASSNDRRTDMRLRTTAYVKLGAEVVWIPDPFKKEIQVITRGSHTLALGNWQELDGGKVLPGFKMPVEKVFADPEWWDGKLPEFEVRQ
jgi:Uma2 family endonuclease